MVSRTCAAVWCAAEARERNAVNIVFPLLITDIAINIIDNDAVLKPTTAIIIVAWRVRVCRCALWRVCIRSNR